MVFISIRILNIRTIISHKVVKIFVSVKDTPKSPLGEVKAHEEGTWAKLLI
jgi:hypothetical protein